MQRSRPSELRQLGCKNTLGRCSLRRGSALLWHLLTTIPAAGSARTTVLNLRVRLGLLLVRRQSARMSRTHLDRLSANLEYPPRSTQQQEPETAHPTLARLAPRLVLSVPDASAKSQVQLVLGGLKQKPLSPFEPLKGTTSSNSQKEPMIIRLGFWGPILKKISGIILVVIQTPLVEPLRPQGNRLKSP